MTASLVLPRRQRQSVLTDVAFVLCGNRLVTVRYDDPKSFRLFSAAMHRIPAVWPAGRR